MIRKISDILKEKSLTYSFEFFPPKTEKGTERLYETAGELKKLNPDFLTVTYGAGGSTRETTMMIVDQLQKRFDIPVMHHLTCIGHTKDELAAMFLKMKGLGIRNILALRGDPPEGTKEWKSTPGGLDYAYQLCEFIRKLHGDYFSIGVAGFPECHINCPDKRMDSRYLKIKQDVGAELVITQLFFDNKCYLEYLERTKAIGVNLRIIPGILPITNYQALLKFCATCGANIPQAVHDIFKPLVGNEEATYKAGVEFAVKQCRELLDAGAPGLDFFTLNKIDPVREVLNKVRR